MRGVRCSEVEATSRFEKRDLGNSDLAISTVPSRDSLSTTPESARHAVANVDGASKAQPGGAREPYETMTGSSKGSSTFRNPARRERESWLRRASYDARPLKRLSTAILVSAVAGAAALAAVAFGAATIAGGDRHASATSVVTGPLMTGFLDPPSFGGPDKSIALDRVRRAGASFVRILLPWPLVAPGGETRPAGFSAKDPGDPRYQWSTVDQEVRAVSAKGLSPLRIRPRGARVGAGRGEATAQ